jgi:hypothetical protein
VFLPRERAHTFKSVGGTARGLLIITPGGLERYFDALHAALQTGDSYLVRAVQAEYGIRPS